MFAVFESRPLATDDEDDWIKDKVDQYTEKHDFLDYAAKHWAVHFREAKIWDDTVVLKSIFVILNPSDF